MRPEGGRRTGAGAALGIGLALLVGGVAARLGAEVRPELWTALELARPPSRLEAPEFTLPDLAGTPVSLKDFRGRVVLLYFWTTW